MDYGGLGWYRWLWAYSNNGDLGNDDEQYDKEWYAWPIQITNSYRSTKESLQTFKKQNHLGRGGFLIVK